MTLCIAALTDTSDGGEHIVGCCDWKIETDVISTETELKFRWLTNEWCAMFGGDNLAHAKELCDKYRVFLGKNHKKLTRDNLLQMLRIPPRRMRRSLADSYTQQMMAVPYSRFLEKDGLGISEEYRRQIEMGIEQQKIQGEIILMGLVDYQLVMARYLHGEVTLQEDFTAIGSGSYIAEAFLYLRSQSRAASLAETIYCVYEAKRFGELAPGVGRSTHMFVMTLNEIQNKAIFTRIRKQEDIFKLEAQLEKFAPRPLKDVPLPPSAETIFARSKLTTRDPRHPTADQSPVPPSQESPGESDVSE